LSTSTNLPAGTDDAITRERSPYRRRRHQRTTNTQDLEATVWQSSRRCATGTVLNLSEGGMLVAGEGAEVGDVAAVELSGRDFRLAGHAEVVHVTSGATGLHVLGWNGPASRRVQSLIMRRIRADGGPGSLWQIPGEFLG
jgi:hypothetical protein